ncbi:Haloalkane dehalogenase [bioreactor metagenome]|uniref:Haloalkane dehalogenase n=1 Tax=bioreactor metagenome TaxID=1076179 RepID=A0A645C3T9_9ZZZZ
MNSSDEKIIGLDHLVKIGGELELYVWEKYQESPANKPIVILAHGSATAGKESFDLQVPGYPSISLMDYLASEGFDVFAPDIRGFGRSTHPEGHITTAEASEDLNAIVDYVIKLRGVDKINLLCWSWGTQYGGMLMMANPNKVNKYISYAQMHFDSPDLAKRRPKLDMFRKNSYIKIPEAGWGLRFYSMTPSEANYSKVVEFYAKVAAQIEERTPTGPQIDMVTMIPMVNPRLISVPTMIIYGEHDDVSDLDGLLPFFKQLPNSYKKYVVIPDAGHMMHLQKGHLIFQQEVKDFLKGL